MFRAIGVLGLRSLDGEILEGDDDVNERCYLVIMEIELDQVFWSYIGKLLMMIIVVVIGVDGGDKARC